MKEITFENIGKGVSLYKFIEKYCLDQGFELGVIAMHRLCSLMRKMGVQTIIVEKMEHDDPDLQAECSSLLTYYAGKTEFKLYRLTFLSINVDEGNKNILLESNNEDFLASAILVNFRLNDSAWRSYLYKAIVKLPHLAKSSHWGAIPLMGRYVHVHRIFTCFVNISESQKVEYEILGTYFAQQNTRTSVCAHATLRMAINNLPDTATLLDSETINKFLNIDHVKIKFGPGEHDRKGINTNEIEDFLRNNGHNCTKMDFFEDPNYVYNHFVYRYIESQLPVLLGFTTKESFHIVPVLGHTLNSDMWRPEAETLYMDSGEKFISSCSWVDHFIIHDDNFGMYLSLPLDALKRITIPMLDPSFRAKAALAILPKGISTPSWEAEIANKKIIGDMLNSLREKIIKDGASYDEWIDRLALSPRPLVLRTLLVDKETYESNLESEDFDGNVFTEAEKKEILKDLPDHFWLSEISLPDLYTANRSKVIEITYGACYPHLDNFDKIRQRWLHIRIPGALWKHKSSHVLGVKKHYPLFRFENQEHVIDW